MVLTSNTEEAKVGVLPSHVTKISETRYKEEYPTLADDGSNFGAWKARITEIL